MAASSAITEIIASIQHDITSGTLNLPVLPDVAFRIRESSVDPDQGINDLAKIVQVDTSMTAYLLQVSNSVLFRGVQQNKDILQALNRLGLKTTRNLAISYSLRALFRPTSPALKVLLQRQWERCTALAAVSAVLAKSCPGFNADRAMLAGLLQDIGALPIIEKLASYPPEILDDSAAINLMIHRFSRRVGVAIMKKWNFDKTLVEVARSREDWMRDPSPEADLADIVLLARLHCYVGTKRMKSLPRLNEVPAFSKLALGELTPEKSIEILAEAKDEIKAIQKVLS